VPVEGLTLYLSGALMDGKYKNLNETSAAFASTELYGVQPDTPQTPDYTIDVGFDFSHDMPGDLFGDFAIGADYYKIDDYITAATNDFHNSGWDIWNAYVSQELGEGFTLKLSGKNLGDDFIVTSGSRALGGFIVMPPREVLLSVTYKYGK
jgi:outer membrane receptor protein involved in Fe transport